MILVIPERMFAEFVFWDGIQAVIMFLGRMLAILMILNGCSRSCRCGMGLLRFLGF